jgi:hypothetical protein
MSPAYTYTLHHHGYATNCYHSAVQFARRVAQQKKKAILVLYHGRQTGHPRNKTADMRKVSFFVRPDGSYDFAKTGDGFFVEPMGAKGITWKE